MNLPAGILLFDSDGVLVDSDASVVEAWSQWADRYDLPEADVLEMVHGRPARQTVAHFLPDDVRPAALDLIVQLELATASTVRAMPGSLETLAGLGGRPWAVITSGTAALAAGPVRAAGGSPAPPPRPPGGRAPWE